jgi:hypothetical protein
MSDSISTGNQLLDGQLAGGLHAGDLLAIRAPPASQSEAFIHTLMEERPTLYMSTLRQADAVRNDLSRVATAGMEFNISFVGETATMGGEMVKKLTGKRTLSNDYSTQSDPLDSVFEQIKKLEGRCNVVLNPTSPLERNAESEKYVAVLNELKRQLMEVGGLGVLHCINQTQNPVLRDTTLTIADVVWAVEHVSKGEEKYRMKVEKNRGDPVAQDSFELFLNRHVEVDATRNL